MMDTAPDTANWDKLYKALVYFLSDFLDGKQMEAITNRIRSFAEPLVGTDQEKLLEGLYHAILEPFEP